MNKPKKVTEINIAKFYRLTTQTLRNYRNSEYEGIRKRYEAMRELYINEINSST